MRESISVFDFELANGEMSRSLEES